MIGKIPANANVGVYTPVKSGVPTTLRISDDQGAGIGFLQFYEQR